MQSIRILTFTAKPLPISQTTIGHVGFLSKQKGVSVCHISKMTCKSSYHLQPCRLLKLDSGGRQLGFMTTNGLSPPTTYSRAGYPNWTLERH